MNKTAEESCLPDPSKLEDSTINATMLSDSSGKTVTLEETGACGDSAFSKDSDSVSVTSDSPSEKRSGAKQSGIKPPSKISRLCAGAHKPGLPVSPPKSESHFFNINVICFFFEK